MLIKNTSPNLIMTSIEKGTLSACSPSLSKLNYKDYPEFMFAMVAAYLPKSEGDDLRRVAGNVVFRHEDSEGSTYKNGVLHSYDDQPASHINGCKEWYQNGKRHRDGDKPAFIYGSWEEWRKNGKLHRDGDKPSVIDRARQEWYKDGKRHREGDLPAFIYCNILEWWKNGEKIR